MNSEPLQPTSEESLHSILAEHGRVLAVGNGTKPPLSRCDDTTLVSCASMTGVIEYESSEFTFTARAGTKVRDISDELATKRQYLPFDPMLVETGATLGGTVASGLAGPGRFRFGGVRDFFLGARLLCGDGRWTNVGGKVVKNAAGFDIPKLLVGSLGRLGVMTELTFKVFPIPSSTLTMRIACESDAVAIERIRHAASGRWELDAIEYHPSQQLVYLRLSGPADVNHSLAREFESLWGADVNAIEADDASEVWRSIGELQWGKDASDDSVYVKVPTTTEKFLQLRNATIDLEGIEMHLSVAGAVTWVVCHNVHAIPDLSDALSRCSLSGLCVRGSATSIWLGASQDGPMENRVKDAMDPSSKFPTFGRECLVDSARH